MNFKSKIFHINSYFITNKLHGELVKKIDEKGYKQTVFIPVENKNQIGLNRIEPLNHTKLIFDNCFNSITRSIWLLKMFQIWMSFKKNIKTIDKPDIIHAHTLIVNGLIAYWSFKKWKIPYVVTIRNTDINLFLKKYPFFRKIAWKILHEATSIITLSPAYGNMQLIKYFPEKQYFEIQKKITVNPNGINDFWLQNGILSQKSIQNPIILFVGRIDRNKNLGTLIQACEILKKQLNNLKLLVVGDGYLLDSIKEGNYSIDIEFLGHINKKEKLLTLYRQAHILAVPSFTESFGLVYAEAMSQGLPVIYTKDQGFDGYFKDGEIGYAVNADNPKQIAIKIEAILNDYQNISKRAYNNSIHFSWDVVSDALINIYNKPFISKQ